MEVTWNIEDTPISHQLQHIPGAVENGGTVSTSTEVGLDAQAQIGVDVAFEEIRNLVDDAQAVDLLDRFHANGPSQQACDRSFFGRTIV